MHELAPVIVSLAMFSIPVVSILTRHQQKMAMILHRPTDEPVANSRESMELRQMVRDQILAVEQLRGEVRELKQLVAAQSSGIMASSRVVVPPAPVLQERV